MTGRDEVEQFRGAITRCFGLRFDDTRLEFLAEVLDRRLSRLGVAAETYIRDLERGPAAAEMAALAKQLTVGETYFFRNSEQFRALTGAVVPQLLRTNAASRRLHVLSAGCATGEEAYSIAIELREAVPDRSWDISVRAVDLNPAALERAVRARYTSWSLRETPSPLEQKWFHREGRELVLDESARTGVSFEARNLAIEDAALWQPQSFDVVFCRNVIMYFAPETARALLARITRALRPGGYLFLGHAETLRGISDAFHLCHTHGTFYYRRKDEVEHTPAAPAIQACEAGFIDGLVPHAGETWFDVIRAASERVASLASRSGHPHPTAAAAPAWDLAAIFDMLRAERFAEALALVRALPAAAARDPDVLLLTAVLLTHSGQPATAEEACQALLQIDELNAGAHYVFALCREVAGDRTAAAEHDRVASYLDASFAMPRLHLGLLARRGGDRDAARRELDRARLLLQGEDASRLLLFGGGFSRHSLIALCESALRECALGHE